MTPGITARPCPVYTCADCDRDMVVLAGEGPADDRCARCRMLPGWHGRSDVIFLSPPCEVFARLLRGRVPAIETDSEVGHA